MRNSDRPQVMALSLLVALAWLCVDLKPAKAFLSEVISGGAGAGRVATADESAGAAIVGREAPVGETQGHLASAVAPRASSGPAEAAPESRALFTMPESAQQTDRQIHLIQRVANAVAGSFAPTRPLLGASPQQIRDVKQVLERAGLHPAFLRSLSARAGVHVEHLKHFRRPTADGKASAQTTTVHVHFVRS